MAEKMRLSSYDMLYPVQGDDELLVNGLYGAYDFITKEEASLLKAEQFDLLCGETRARLLRRGHLVCMPEEQEEENARIISRAYWLLPYRKYLDVVLLPTYNCNFRCEYCFERKRLEKGQEWLGHNMTPEMVDTVFATLKKIQDCGVALRQAVLFGGEPLLPGNKAMVTQMMKRLHDMGTKIICITNGYALDQFIEEFKQYGTSFIQITVDGPAEVHDARRYLAGGKGSYSRIMDNVELALKNGLNIHMRTNVNRSNLESSFSLLDEYERRGFMGNEHFYPYFKATTGCYEDDPANAITDEELFRALMEYRKLDMDQAVKLCRVHSGMSASIHGALTGEHYPPLRPANCGAMSDMLCIDPDGTLYSCWDLVSMEERAVGILDRSSERFLYDFSIAKWRNRTVDQMDTCRRCPYLMVCGGGCMVESEFAYGDGYHGFCGSNKEAFDDVVAAICAKKFAKDGKREMSLSWFDLFAGLTEDERQQLLSNTDPEKEMEILQKHMTAGSRIFG